MREDEADAASFQPTEGEIPYLAVVGPLVLHHGQDFDIFRLGQRQSVLATVRHVLVGVELEGHG
jgi:hypothetical protein